jgi:Tfp pilus assembly protein PilV
MAAQLDMARRLDRTGREPGSGSWRKSVTAEGGFTVIEALVAALVLTAGLLTSFMMLVASTHTSADVRARETAVTLARQISEDARSIPFSQLSASTIASSLQAMPGLANSSSGSTWTIIRNGFTYTISVSVNPVYDSKDPANAAGASTVDLQQVAVSVSWATFQRKIRRVTETMTVSRAGQDPGLIASGLELAPADQNLAGIIGSPVATAPVVTSSAIGSLQFAVTAPSGTSAIVWSLNGGKQASWAGAAPSSGTTWTSSPWSLAGVSDGTYTIGAQAEDANGVDGPAVTIQVRLIRNVPSAPNVTGDGFDPYFMVDGNATTVADLQWSPNPELNVIGYVVYNPVGQKICTTSTTAFTPACGPNAWCSSPNACVDLAGGQWLSSASRTYTVKALYYDAYNTLQEGSAATVTLASGTPVPPPPVPIVSLSVVTQPDNTAVITWSPPVSGTPVSFYRIYRDGDNYTNRYDTLPAASCSATCTYHDTNRTAGHDYYITAVGGTSPGADMAESQATGPVSG